MLNFRKHQIRSNIAIEAHLIRVQNVFKRFVFLMAAKLFEFYQFVLLLFDFFVILDVPDFVPSLSDMDNEIVDKCFNFLSIDELCTVKGVCKRFRSLAETAFKRRHGIDITFDDPIVNIQKTTRIIKCFGQCMEGVTIEGSIAWDLNTTIMSLISQYCTQKLCRLRLICVHFDKSAVKILQHLVPRLEEIEFLYCTIESNQRYSTIFKSAENLKTLIIIGKGEVIDLKFLSRKWPNFEKLEIISERLLNETVLTQFLKQNRAIKYLSYLPNTLPAEKLSWLEHMPDLEHLSIDLSKDCDYVRPLSRLKNLQSVAIRYRDYEKPIDKLMVILSKITTLATISLWNVALQKILTFPSFQYVKTLELRDVKFVADRKVLSYEIQRQWNNIENLRLDQTAVRTADDVELYIECFAELKNLFLCDMRSVITGAELLPTKAQYKSWCSQRIKNPVCIFVDCSHLQTLAFADPNENVVFRPFKNRLCQTVNIMSSTGLNNLVI